MSLVKGILKGKTIELYDEINIPLWRRNFN